MKHEVERPVMKQTPSGHPVTLMNVAQTNVEGALGVARINNVINPMVKRHKVRVTVELLTSKEGSEYGMAVAQLTPNIVSPRSPLERKHVVEED
jgi:anaerobic ribonucleoside-triphosphate reductase